MFFLIILYLLKFCYFIYYISNILYFNFFMKNFLIVNKFLLLNNFVYYLIIKNKIK